MCSFPGVELPPPYPPPQAGEGREGGCGQQEARDADPASEVDLEHPLAFTEGQGLHPATKDTAADSLGAEEDPLQ